MRIANSIDAVSHRVALMRLLGYSGIGVVIFFWSVDIGGKSTILFEKDMLPFLFEKLVMPVGLIVPLGAIALASLEKSR
jgi:nucleoside recognition membrane protein YjiH